MRRDNSAARGGMMGAGLLAMATLVTACARHVAAPAAPRSISGEASLQAATHSAPPAPTQAGLSEQAPTMMQAKVTHSPFTLTAALADTAPESQPVVLTLALHNDGAQSCMIGGSAFEQSSFEIAVTDSQGKSVPRTAVGDRALTPPTAVSANMMLELGPGQTFHYHYNLAHLFDLSRTGNYSVRVSRTVATRPFFFPGSNAARANPVSPSPALPPQVDLQLGPLPFRMISDPASVSGFTASAPTPGERTFLYVTSPYKPGVARYRVGDDGGVSLAVASKPPDSPPVTVQTYGDGPGAPVATPDGRFLYYVNSDRTMSQFRIGDDGVLSPLSPPTIPAPPTSDTLLMEPKGRALYALPGSAFAIGTDGQLTSLTAAGATAPPGACAIDSTGTHLYVSNGLTYGYRIDSSGRLIALPVPTTSATGIATGRDNAVALSPSGRFAYIGVSTSGGSAYFDLVVPMRVASDGTLTPIPGGARVPQAPAYPPGYAPFQCKALAVDPSGHFLVVLHPGYLDGFRIEADGTLTPLGMTLVRGDLDSVFFLPDHPIAYVLNRNPPSLLAFRLDDQRGVVPAGLDMPGDIPFQANIAAAVAPVPNQWGPAVGGLEVSARVPADDVPAGQPIVMTVTLGNTTDHTLSLGPAGADMSEFRLLLTGPLRRSPGMLRPGGEPATTQAPLLAAGRDLLGTPLRGGAPVVLPPHGERAYRLVLTRLADITVAGNYTVQVTRSLPGGEVAGSPVIPLLLEGPFDGVVWNPNGNGVWQGVDVL